MDFFEHQDRARTSSSWLVFYFFLAVILTTLTLYVAVAAFFFRFQFGTDGALALWNTEVFLMVAVPTLLVIGAGSLYKISVLSRGGSAVAESLGGRPIEPNTSDADERRVLNVVEEMSIASGIPVPTVYLLDNERSINAFAAGFTPSDAVIGVTRGAVKLLSRDELQGVIAHEFSHVFNGDMRLNMRLMGVLHGILLLALIGYAILRRGHVALRRREAGPALFLALALLIVGSIGFFFGRLIQAAVSRQREFLADASAVQFTRNSAGIAGALKKIGGLVEGSRLQSPKGLAVSHMLFSNGLHRVTRRRDTDSSPMEGSARFLDRSSLLSTHPPLAERIRRIDPSFDGMFPVVKVPETDRVPAPQTETEMPSQGQTADVTTQPAVSAPPSFAVDPEGLAKVFGNPSGQHVAYAAGLLAMLPGALRSRTQEPSDARAVILALLLGSDSAVRQAQFRTLSKATDPFLAQATLDVSSELSKVLVNARIPLIDLCLPALRKMSAPQYEEFTSLVDDLIHADHRTELFEFTLSHILRRHLDPHFGNVRSPAVHYRSLDIAKTECELLLSSLAHAGHSDETAAREAFHPAAAELGQVSDLRFRPRGECGLRSVRVALEKLTLTSHAVRRAVLRAAAASVSHDNHVTVKEGELLRAIADALECPLPPLIAGEKLRRSA